MVYSRTIRGHKYLYRSVRKGEKVISEYVGKVTEYVRKDLPPIPSSHSPSRCNVCGKLLIADKAIYCSLHKDKRTRTRIPLASALIRMGRETEIKPCISCGINPVIGPRWRCRHCQREGKLEYMARYENRDGYKESKKAYDAKRNMEKKWMRDMKLMGIQPRIKLNLSFS